MRLKEIIALLLLGAGLFAAIQFFTVYFQDRSIDTFKDTRPAIYMIGLALFSGLSLIAAAVIISGRRDR